MTGLTVVTLLLVKVVMTGLSVVTVLLLVKVLMTGLTVVMYYYL